WAIGASLGPPLVGATRVVSDSWWPAYVIAAATFALIGVAVYAVRSDLSAAPELVAEPPGPSRISRTVLLGCALTSVSVGLAPAPDRERSRAASDRVPRRRRDDRWRVPAGGGGSPHAVPRRRHPRPVSCDDGRGAHRAAPRIDASGRGARLRAPGLQVERLRDPGTDESRKVADMAVTVMLVERTCAPVGLRDEQNEMPAARRAGI